MRRLIFASVTLAALCLLPLLDLAVLPLDTASADTDSARAAGEFLQTERYSLVRVFFEGIDDAAFLAENPDLDVASVKPGVGAEIIATPATLDMLLSRSLQMEIVHDDLAAYYASRLDDRGGNFGGWHTYSQNIAYLDSLRLVYPQQISAKWSIGQTHLNNDIWCVRLSSNPDVAQPDKPEVLLITMLHAREIMSGDFGIMFADYLCSNYGTDPVVTWLMDNRELYIVSIANPDGVLYNEQTNPAGGGMWRKNRRNNGGGVFGVDLNRNFPYEWVGPGSSSNPSSDTYRGPAPASEPETQALINLVNSHNFFAVQDMHTYSNLTLYPWGYTTDPTPHASTFIHMATIMAQYNGYLTGQPGEILYIVNGGSIDWLYGEAYSFAFCNEVGSGADGFWPPINRREELFQDNVWPMLYLMMAAGAYADVTDAVATDSEGGLLEPGDSGLLSFKVANHGVTEGLSGAQVFLSSDDPYLQLAEASRNIPSIDPMDEIVIDPPFAFTIDEACPDGHLVTVTVRCEFDGGAIDYPINFMVGEPDTIFFDDFAAGTGNWTLTHQWGLTSSSYHSPPSSLTDSPSGNYGNNWNATATLNGTYQASALSFWHRYDMETNYDFGRVQVSADGSAWQTIASYTGTQNSWQKVTLDLDQFAGQDLELRFLLYTDWWVTADGWYVDDVTLLGAGNDNQAPPPPPLIAPEDDAVIENPVTLVVGNVDDPDGGPVTYGFRVYGDPLLTQIIASADGVPAGPGSQTSWQVPTLADGAYWWRAYAADDEERGLLGETRGFEVNASSGVELPAMGQPRLLVQGQGSGRIELELSLPQGADVAVRIYSADGRMVRELHQGRIDAGSRSLTWDGRDGQGRQGASGIYLVRATVGDVALTARVVLVR